ncbi:MAG: hypothetical protein ABJC98_06615, partial [Bacteroidota bacterium]
FSIRLNSMITGVLTICLFYMIAQSIFLVQPYNCRTFIIIKRRWNLCFYCRWQLLYSVINKERVMQFIISELAISSFQKLVIAE